MFFPDYLWVENARGGVQRVDRRIDAQFGQLAGQHGGGVQVCESGGWSRIGQVVRGNVNRLHRRDGSALGRGNPFLKCTHFGREGGLIPDRRWHTAEQRRYFGSCLRKAEDVVDEEQHILVLFVTEIFCDRQSGETNAETCARRLIHLSIDQRGFRLREIIRINDLRLLHLVPKVIALARPLTHTREHRESAVVQGDVIDELHDDNRLADPCTSEESDLASLAVGLQQIDHLDACFKHFCLGLLIFELRSRPDRKSTRLNSSHLVISYA